MKRKALAAFAGPCLVAICLCATACGSRKSSSDSEDYKTILGDLHVAEVGSPPALKTVSTTGAEVTIADPDVWTPLRHTYATFNPSSEVFALGMKFGTSGSTTYYNGLYDDGKGGGYALSSPITDDQSWEQNCIKKSCAADLDGDGIAEFIVFYATINTQGTTDTSDDTYAMHMRVYHDGAFSADKDISAEVPASANLGTTSDALRVGYYNSAPTLGGVLVYPYFAMSAADVDGDGKDEILVTDYRSAYVLSIDAAGKGATVEDSITYASAISDFVGGDCDGDGKAELMVCVDGQGCMLYDSAFDEPLFSTGFFKPYAAGTVYATEACFGDFNGDNIDEIAIVQDTATSIIAYTYSWDNSSGTPMLKSAQTITSTNLGSTGAWVMNDYRGFPRAFDADGDGKDELFISSYVCRNVMTSSSDTTFVGGLFGSLYAIRDIRVGDVDGDHQEDLVYFADQYVDSTPRFAGCVGAIGRDSTGAYVTKHVYIDKSTSGASTHSSMVHCCSIAVGNADKDSARVKYVGHKLMFSNPIVIAALASPPYYSEIAAAESSYSPGNWQTTFGKTTSASSSQSVSASMSAGVTLEYEQHLSIFGIDLGNVKTSAAFKTETSCEFSFSTSVTQSVSYSCVGGEDRVVFTALPIDVYSYEVLELGEDSTEGAVGDILKIDIPRQCSIYSVDRDYYNSHNGDFADVGTAVLGHTLGVPSTYPDASAKASLLAQYPGYATDEAYSLGQYDPAKGSGGVTSLEIAVESGKETTASVNVSAEFAAGGGGGGFTAMATFGFSAGYSYTTGTTAGTIFGGTIGNLPTAYYDQAKYPFKAGLFSYLYTEPQTCQKYWVVDYWRE